MKWFRLYDDFRHDPKMKRMPIHHRYAFVVLLCLANESSTRGVVTGLDDEDLAFELEMNLEEWQALKAEFEAKGLVSVAGESIKICDWTYDQNFRDRPPAHVWRSLRSQIFERDDYTCQYCGDRGVHLHCDHIVPVSRGGSNDISNLATSCQRCNQSKGCKTIEEWRGHTL